MVFLQADSESEGALPKQNGKVGHEGDEDDEDYNIGERDYGEEGDEDYKSDDEGYGGQEDYRNNYDIGDDFW